MPPGLMALLSVPAAAIAWASLCFGPLPYWPQTTVPTEPVAATNWSPARTSWGHPDLHGIWTMNSESSTPFERPREFGNRAVLTDEEFAKRRQRVTLELEDEKTDRKVVRGARYKGNEEGPTHWYEKTGESRRTSMIIDPPDGRLPPMTPAAQKRHAATREMMSTRGEADGFEDRSTYERCINRAKPMIPYGYDNAVQILQTPDFVVLRYEPMHESRVIPLDGRPHIAGRVRQWNGDPRGRWEGDTLVVSSTNFSDKQEFAASAGGKRGRGTPQGGWRLVERFVPVGPNAIEYQATVNDPVTWTQPWTLAQTWRKDPGYQIFEYACHEGNYGLRNILTGARAADEAAEDAVTKSGRRRGQR